MLLKKIDRKKNLLIVGGTGFIGSNLAKKAINNGYKVTIISKNRPQLSKKIEEAEYINVDIRNKKNLFLKLKNKSFNYVINLSGSVDHSKHFDGGSNVFETHFVGATNIFILLCKSNNHPFFTND